MQINKAMLSSFKVMLDGNQFRFPESAQKGNEEDESDDFADDGKYEDEELYNMDPEKAEAERQKAVAFFREMLTHAAAENAASSAPKP